MLLAGIVMVINQKFFISGFRAVLNLSPNMDTLVALGSGVSYVYSIAVVFQMIADNSAHHLHSHNDGNGGEYRKDRSERTRSASCGCGKL